MSYTNFTRLRVREKRDIIHKNFTRLRVREERDIIHKNFTRLRVREERDVIHKQKDRTALFQMTNRTATRTRPQNAVTEEGLSKLRDGLTVTRR